MRPYAFHPLLGRHDLAALFTTPGGITMSILLLAVIGIVIYLVVSRKNHPSTYQTSYRESHKTDDPVAIAKQRFARGEISQEELTGILETLKKL